MSIFKLKKKKKSIVSVLLRYTRNDASSILLGPMIGTTFSVLQYT